MLSKIAAIYIRVSTDHQAEEGYSIDAQKEQLTAYCISKGIKNYKYYIDGGWSGSNLDRPEMQKLIEDVKNEKVSHVIIYKLDRLSRSQKDTLYLIEDVLNFHNVDFICLTENIDTTTPVGRLMLGVLSAFAQLERENIRLRTRMGMKERVKDGYWMGGGRIPFGYDYDKEKGILVPNKDAEKVKQVYDLYIKGYSCQGIANMLGLKYDRLAMQILTRKSNYGIIEYNGEEYQGRHEPIISKEIYDIAMNELYKRQTKGFGNKSPSMYLLSGLVYCGKCGAKMRYQKWGKKGTKLVCYSQQKGKPYLVKDENCNQDKPWANDIEDVIINLLFHLKDTTSDETSSTLETTAIDVLNTQKDELERKIKRLYNLYSESEDDILIDTINENKKKLEAIKQRIKFEIVQTNLNTNKDELKTTIMTLEETWEYMTAHEKQNIVRSIVDKVIITDDNVNVKLNI